MRTLVSVFSISFFLIPALSFGYSCKSLDQAAKFLNVKSWMNESREFRLANKSEPIIELASKESATNYAYRFPALDQLGFGKPNALQWTKVIGRMERSPLKGKVIGWERKLEDGSWARIRLDYAPKAGAHYNIEVRLPSGGNKFESFGLSIRFTCGESACTEADILKMAQKLNN